MDRRPNSAGSPRTLDTSHQAAPDRPLADSPSGRGALASAADRPRFPSGHLLSAVLFALVVLTATLIRLGFTLRPPPFLTPDSQGYYLPGWELAQGLGFGPELRRTPVYPLFIAWAVLLFGEDL